MAAQSTNLQQLLHKVFGHKDFRPHQQPVCEAAASGRDVLLVMPTGAGKSLCYQLPALARGGTALVISPLIALMDDQASKLSALNLRVARIHSGLSRDDARSSCRAYLDGHLDFLFIAPERLRVPGFPEMLARRKPALIAIDEAHCISQWGHDFRPDYRTLGQHLPALRPAPVIALTATATPAVQKDIVRALDLQDPAIFITGFRRTNLHIEIVEVSKPQRLDAMRKLLAPESARPAIVYASSRRTAEELAGTLGERFPAAAYHAGLDPGTRDRVQRAFLSGKLDVVVATVAFGMGIDKADVRTVVHAALPGSVEAYYQEIGRAGRDGKPSRAVLLHSFADRKTLEFLLERNYPPVQEIQRIVHALDEELTSLDALQRAVGLDRETVESCVDKLLIQGVVTADLDGRLRRTNQNDWQRNYDLQVQYRRAQIDRIVAYAEGNTCRMGALVRHFGDMTDSGAPCSDCDICRPEGATVSAQRQASAEECDELRAILRALVAGSRSAGKLLIDLRWSDRKHLDVLTDALARAGLLTIASETFRADDGREVPYKKLAITPEGRTPDDATLATVWLRGGETLATPASGKRSRSKPSASPKPKQDYEPLSGSEAELEKQLKDWRLSLARTNGVPPFTVFHDSVLRNLAQLRPANLRELENVRGIGPEKLNRYGSDLLALCSGRSLPSPPQKPEATAKLRQRTPEPDGNSNPPARSVPRSAPSLSSAPVQQRPSQPALPPPVALTPQQVQLETRLRDWRREQASTAGLPSFLILSDTALRRVVAANPTSLADLSSLAEVGPDKLERYGPALVELCRA